METGFLDMVMQATLVAKLVLLLLVFMSVGSWTIIIHKWISLSRAKRKAIAGLDRFTNARDLRDAVQTLSGDTASPLYHVAQQGVAEFNRLKEAGNSGDVVMDNVRRSLRQGVSEAMSRLSKSTSFLATCANTAPFIGLFGTVWGIMYSFHQIGMQKSASLATVAPGISEALIATAVGLFVAIPATVGYNSFLGAMQGIESELVNFAGVFLNRVQRELNAHTAPPAGRAASHSHGQAAPVQPQAQPQYHAQPHTPPVQPQQGSLQETFSGIATGPGPVQPGMGPYGGSGQGGHGMGGGGPVQL